MEEVKFELRFRSIYNPGHGFGFPCSPLGEVLIDSLTEKGRTNYFFARATVGREFLTPEVVQH